MAPIVVKNHISMAAGGALLGLCGAVALGIAVYFDAQIGMGFALLGGVALLLPACVYKLFDRRVQLKIDESGIRNRQWPIDLLPWSQIESVEVRSDCERKYVCVVPKPDSEYYDELCGNGIFHVGEESTPCAKIDSFDFDVDFYSFKDEVLRYYEKVKAA